MAYLPPGRGERLAGAQGREVDWDREAHRVEPRVERGGRGPRGLRAAARIPPMERDPALGFNPIAKAESVIEALRVRTDLKVLHGAIRPPTTRSATWCRFPPKRDHHTAYDSHAGALPDCGHSIFHPKRMDRRPKRPDGTIAIGKWRD